MLKSIDKGIIYCTLVASNSGFIPIYNTLYPQFDVSLYFNCLCCRHVHMQMNKQKMDKYIYIYIHIFQNKFDK